MTALRTALQIGVNFTGLDGIADTRDIVYDVTHFEKTSEHVIQTIADGIAFLPVIGAGKYADEAVGVVKKTGKAADTAGDTVKNAAKYGDEVADAAKAAAKKAKKNKGPKTYQTYTKKHKITGKIYSGRTSGTDTPTNNVFNRDRNHHMNAKGYGPAQLDKSSSSYAAIRGREQMLIDKNGRAQSMGGTSGNVINGIGKNNVKREDYINAAKEEFGEIE